MLTLVAVVLALAVAGAIITAHARRDRRVRRRLVNLGAWGCTAVPRSAGSAGVLIINPEGIAFLSGAEELFVVGWDRIRGITTYDEPSARGWGRRVLMGTGLASAGLSLHTDSGAADFSIPRAARESLVRERRLEALQAALAGGLAGDAGPAGVASLRELATLIAAPPAVSPRARLAWIVASVCFAGGAAFLNYQAQEHPADWDTATLEAVFYVAALAAGVCAGGVFLPWIRRLDRDGRRKGNTGRMLAFYVMFRSVLPVMVALAPALWLTRHGLDWAIGSSWRDSIEVLDSVLGASLAATLVGILVAYVVATLRPSGA